MDDFLFRASSRGRSLKTFFLPRSPVLVPDIPSPALVPAHVLGTFPRHMSPAQVSNYCFKQGKKQGSRSTFLLANFCGGYTAASRARDKSNLNAGTDIPRYSGPHELASSRRRHTWGSGRKYLRSAPPFSGTRTPNTSRNSIVTPCPSRTHLAGGGKITRPEVHIGREGHSSNRAGRGSRPRWRATRCRISSAEIGISGLMGYSTCSMIFCKNRHDAQPVLHIHSGSHLGSHLAD
ncbi:hypothetical protein FB451DRAFT_1284492 [Mycena latifolia]|nr:hypothetical protein FB451DRAFT_1284492 [Mycena latifolia]